jgi:preprotein translocase subunit SecE
VQIQIFWMKEKIINFFVDIFKEMKKVSWPKKQELKDSTVIVVITMILFAVFVYIIDMGISNFLKLLF